VLPGRKEGGGEWKVAEGGRKWQKKRENRKRKRRRRERGLGPGLEMFVTNKYSLIK
jgi:hypothetical protein